MASLWVMDHFFQISMVGPPEHEMLEGYTRARASRPASPSGSGWARWSPASPTATRACWSRPSPRWTCSPAAGPILGIGAAWNEEEHRGLGVPFPPLRERFERLEETLQIAHQMWAGDDSPFDGKHYQLERPLNSPAGAVASRTRRSWSAAAARRRRCGSWRSTPTPATSSTMGADAVRHKLDVLQRALRRRRPRLRRDREDDAGPAGAVRPRGEGTRHRRPGRAAVRAARRDRRRPGHRQPAGACTTRRPSADAGAGRAARGITPSGR